MKNPAAMSRYATPLMLFALAIGIGRSGTAHAAFPWSSCADGAITIRPFNGQQEIPTDARLTLWTAAASQVDLIDDYLLVLNTDDVNPIIDFDVERHSFGDWDLLQIVPEQNLEPDSNYILFPAIESGENAVYFRTASGASTEPPGEVWIRETWTGGGCCTPNQSTFDPVYITAEIGGHLDNGSFYQIEISEDETFADSTVVWSYEDVVELGYTSDHCDTLGGDIVHGDQVFIRVRAVDLAGNASDWSVAISTELSDGYRTTDRGVSYTLVALILIVSNRRFTRRR